MDPVDQLILRQETDLRRRSTITLIVQLDRTPHWDDLVERLSRTVRAEPRLRQRVVRPWSNLGAPEWVVDDDLDVRPHLTRGTLAAPGAWRELMDFVESIPDGDIVPTRPLWHITVLDGAADGGAALVVRMSHVLTDGMAGMQLLAGLVDAVPQPPSSPAPEASPADPEPWLPLTSARLTVERVLTAPLRIHARYWRNYSIAARATVAVLSDPRRTVNQATDYALSLLRVAAPKTAPPSFAERSAQRRLVYLEVSAADLRSAGQSVGGSLNDAYLAGVTGGLRRYHEMKGMRPCPVPFAIPVSTRGRAGAETGQQDAGNRFAGVRFSAPVGVADPAERLRQIGAIVRTARAEPALDAMTTLAPALVQLPDRVLGLAGRAQDRLDMQASYVPGPPVPISLVGAGVTSMVAFGPLPGPAAMSVLLTYNGVARVGITVDAVAIPDIAALEQAMIEGFAEVLGLVSPVHASGA